MMCDDVGLDVNKCDTDNGGCDQHASCNYVDGSYSCLCKQGYIGNGYNCTSMSAKAGFRA